MSTPPNSTKALGPAKRIPMRRLQQADKILGTLAFLALQPLRLVRKLWKPKPGNTVLMIKFWGIGSIQLLGPAVQSLRQRHPGCPIHILTLIENAEFARRLGLFDRVTTLDVADSSWLRILKRIFTLLVELRRNRFRAVYDFEFFTRFSAVMTFLVRSPESTGFSSPHIWRGWLHSHNFPFNRYWHVGRNFRGLAGGENGHELTWRDLIPAQTNATDERELQDVISESSLAGAGPIVVLNPNAGSLSLERRWPPDHFAELARRLIREEGAQVALIGSAGEAEWTGQVAAMLGPQHGDHVANLAGKLSLGGLGVLLQRADVVVSNDSGPMHLAAAYGAPTLGLFGPETPVMYAPLGSSARALYRPPACSPCINVHENKVANCFRGKPECLLNLTVEDVLAETRALMARGRLRSTADPMRTLPGAHAAKLSGS